MDAHGLASAEVQVAANTVQPTDCGGWVLDERGPSLESLSADGGKKLTSDSSRRQARCKVQKKCERRTDSTRIDVAVAVSVVSVFLLLGVAGHMG